MPLPREVFQKLVNGQLKSPTTRSSDYLDKLPTLEPNDFPDSLRIWDVSASGGTTGQKLHGLLEKAGLTKGQRSGVTHLLDSFVKMGENDLTVGDIRALSEEELLKLQNEFSWGKPSILSIKKIKKLFG